MLTATVYFLLPPLNEALSELLARTSPTLYDVLIALCGGAAGILTLSTMDKDNVIPGVAVPQPPCRRSVQRVTDRSWERCTG